jgi:predicted nucleotidyltransferase
MILFGSQARGQAGVWSDLDIAVVSPDFKGVPPFERLVWLGKIAWNADATAIEAIGFTPEEFREAAPWEFAEEIRRVGKVVYKAK